MDLELEQEDEWENVVKEECSTKYDNVCDTVSHRQCVMEYNTECRAVYATRCSTDRV